MLKPREKIRRYKWSIAFSAAVINDLIDLTGPGNIPVFGDLLDAFTSGVIWRLVGKNTALPTVLEFVPGTDLIPIYTISVLVSWFRNRRNKN